MNVLLLLSALLSALSGLGGGARAPVAVQAVAGMTAARPVSAAAVRGVATRPAAGLPAVVQVASAPVATASPLPQTVPLWASRRRE